MKIKALEELIETAENMYRLGWNERNGGNISYLLDEEDAKKLAPDGTVLRTVTLGAAVREMAGKYFLVTGTGKYFKNFRKEPANNIALVRISEQGDAYHVLWGLEDGTAATSEITMHLGAHMNRLLTDPNHRVVLHAHPTNILSMTHIHDLDSYAFTKTLWQMCTECLVIFPDGLCVLPWAVSSSVALGLESAKKFRQYRAVIWALHGLTVAGTSFDEAFGLMETIEKAAEIYMKICCSRRINVMDDSKLRALANAFGVDSLFFREVMNR